MARVLIVPQVPNVLDVGDAKSLLVAQVEGYQLAGFESQQGRPLPFTKPSTGKQMQKPYIQLDQNFPGIVSLFMYDKDNAKNLMSMAQTIMRRERPKGLSVGERELIASFVSKLNECRFCCDSHSSCTAEYLGQDVVNQVIYQQNSEVLSEKMQSLLAVAACIQALDRNQLAIQVSIAKGQGATDEEIHDTVLVTSFFSMCNRYVDGLGTTFQMGEPEEGGRGLAKYGYIFGIRRFIGEVLPKLWSKFWR